ncbi:MAG TPA: hypothetical protein VGJ94_05925 [Syntrophorhabdaceae bacterium]|jgi:hypothetical protein
MTHRENVYCGISYIIAGTLAFLGTMTPLLDMRNLFPDIYLNLSTLYLLWVPAILISLLGFLNLQRRSREFSPAYFIASALTGVVLTITSIVTSAGAITYAGEGNVEPSWRLGIGSLMLLAAFVWTIFFPLCRMIRAARAKTLEKRIMANLLYSRASSNLRRGTYWQYRLLSKGIQGRALLPQ